MNDQKNLLLAITLSLTIFFGFNYFFPSRPIEQVAQPTVQSATTSIVTAPAINQAAVLLPRDIALKEDIRIPIKTPSVTGSLRLKGAIIDDVELLNYKDIPEEKSPHVVLLAPQKTHRSYSATFNWLASDSAIECPNENTLWQVEGGKDGAVLSPDKALKLSYTNKQGIRFERTFTVDKNYLFTITDHVTNANPAAVHLQTLSHVTRVGTPVTNGFFVLHEGGVGVLNRSLSEVSYDDMKKKHQIQQQTTGGWIGFTDKYWLVALIPSPKDTVNASYLNHPGDVYQTQTTGQLQTVEPGKTLTVTQHLYAGAKVLSILDSYEKSHGFDRFDLAVDFGWFYFLTKPLFYALDFFHKLLGNMGLAILLLTVLFKIALFPLANKSHRSMSRMKNLQPKMEKLKQTYGNDKMRMNQELMNLYKKENANPMSGCLPMLVQAPLFFCLYKVFFVTIEMRQAPFFGWIHDLASPDPTSFLNLFGLLPWDAPSFLAIGAWPLLMGVTMVVQQRLGPQPADPQQAKLMMLMPILFTYMFASFPAGLVIYWAWSNILTVLQQLYINSRPEPVIEKKKASKRK